MAYFLCNSGKSVSGGYKIIVTAPVGSVIVATQGQLIVSGTVSSSGSCELTVPTSGTWSVTATYNSNSVQKNVFVKDVETSFEFNRHYLYDSGNSYVSFVKSPTSGANSPQFTEDGIVIPYRSTSNSILWEDKIETLSNYTTINVLLKRLGYYLDEDLTVTGNITSSYYDKYLAFVYQAESFIIYSCNSTSVLTTQIKSLSVGASYYPILVKKIWLE